jgi:hypothetical protein
MTGAQEIQVSLLLRNLAGQKLVKGTKVTDYEGAIEKWAERPIRFQAQSYALPNVLRVLRHTYLEYAITTYRAESMINHYLFPTINEIYVRASDVDQWHNLFVRERAMVGGGNVRIRWYDDEVLRNSFLFQSYRLVTIPQLIVDLIRSGGVAVQAARQLIEKYNDFLRLNDRLINSRNEPSEANHVYGN